MKQRLVGTLVLGCLAIILIPLLLDGDGIAPPPLSASIPPAPELDLSPIAEPQRPVINSDSLPVPGTATTEVASDPAAEPPLPAFEPGQTPTTQPIASTVTTTPAAPDALEAAVAAVLSRDNSEATSTDAIPALDASGLPLAFVVRLGSFAERSNADALVARLLAAGHKAYARQVGTATGTMTAVYVGPVPTKAEANTLVTQLGSSFQLTAVVENFTTFAR